MSELPPRSRRQPVRPSPNSAFQFVPRFRSINAVTAAAWLVLFLLKADPVALADGFRNPFQGAAAIAQGNAFTAQADDPTAIHYNPAGITQLSGIQNSLGLQFINVNVHFTSPTGVTAEDQDDIVGFPPPGQLFLTANLKDLGVRKLGNLSVGLGIQNIFGFSSKYPEDGPFATAVTTAQLPLLGIKPTFAYKISDQLSIGLGVDILTFASFLGEGHLEQQFLWPGGGGIPAGTTIELNGTGTTAGMNASFLYTILGNENNPLLNLGFVWRSQTVLPIHGEFLADGVHVADLTTSLRFPEIYNLGIAGWPLRDEDREWKVEADVDYVRWQSVKDASIHLSNGVTLPNSLQLRNAVSVMIGTEYKWLHSARHQAWEYAARTGYIRSQSAYTDASFTPVNPDTGANVVSVGFGFLCRQGGAFLGLIDCGSKSKGKLKLSAIGVDLAYQYLWYNTRTISGNANPAVDGTYRSHLHVGSITFRVVF